MVKKRRVKKLISILRDIDNYYQNLYQLKINRYEKKDRQQELDILFLQMFSQEFGLHNPYYWSTIEFYPLLLDDMHYWHLRMGLPRLSTECSGCC